MTDAKIVARPSKGHGLTDRITDTHFAAFSRGEPTGMVPAVVMPKVHGAGGQDTANGRTQFVQYELCKLEPITDSGDASELQFMIEALYKERTAPGGQTALPISFPGQQTEEKRKAVLEAIDDRWAELGKTGAEGEQDWRDHFGIGSDPEANLYGIPGDYNKASFAHLSQYAFAVGALGGEAEEPKLPDGDALGNPDDDPLADDEATADAIDEPGDATA